MAVGSDGWCSLIAWRSAVGRWLDWCVAWLAGWRVARFLWVCVVELVAAPWALVSGLLDAVGLGLVSSFTEATFFAFTVDVWRGLWWPQPVRLWGFHLFVGNKGQGKTSSMVEALDVIRRKYGDAVDVFTNFGWSGEDGPIVGPDHVIALQFSTRPTVLAFDEIAQEFQSSQYARLDEEWITFLTQQRKWGSHGVLMLGSAQRAAMTEVTFRRLADFIIECSSYSWQNRRWVHQEWFAGIENYLDGHDFANGFKRDRARVRAFHFDDRLRGQYDSFSRVARLSDGDHAAKRQGAVIVQLEQLAAVRAARAPSGDAVAVRRSR